jgi:hypothetical protein
VDHWNGGQIQVQRESGDRAKRRCGAEDRENTEREAQREAECDFFPD